MQKLIILGAGTFAVEVTDLVQDIGGYEIVGYCVDREGPIAVEKEMLLSPLDLVNFAKIKVIGAMVSVERMQFINLVLAMGFEPITLVHPSASVSRTAVVLPGSIINRQVAIGAYAGIGSHVIVNRGALIGHHTSIGPYSTIGPGANIAGQCRIGVQVTVGMGAMVVEKTTIASETKIKAGSLVGYFSR